MIDTMMINTMITNKKIIFMGTPDFAVPCLEALVSADLKPEAVVTQPDKPVGRGYKYTPPPVKVFAEKNNILVLQPHSLKTTEIKEELTKIQPDVIITVAYGKILPADILNIPKLCCINVHASLLPQLRGANPISLSIIQGFEVTGITTMLMDEGMDTGDILQKIEVPISQDMNFQQLHDILAQKGARLLIETLKSILSKDSYDEIKKIAVPQDNSKATYAPVMRRSNARIVWNAKASDIHNFVRGTYGWPVAWCVSEKGVMKVWNTKLSDEPCPEGKKPGGIIRADSLGLTVACGNGDTIIIDELQFESQKRMKAAEYILGHAGMESWILR